MFWDVLAKCGTCGHKQIIATFNEHRDARAWAASRPKQRNVVLLIERGW